jgi:hypothetical protein
MLLKDITVLDEQLKKYGNWRYSKFPLYFPRFGLKMICMVSWQDLNKIVKDPQVRYFSIKPNLTIDDESLFAVGFENVTKISDYNVKIKYLTK